MKKTIIAAALTLCVCALILNGCGPKGPKRVEISGKVTVDGEPVGKGTIKFDPVDGQGSSDGGAINDGAFICEVTTGEKKVTVNGSKVVGKFEYDPMANPGKMADKVEDYPGLPFKEEKTVTVQKKGDTFDLDYSTSK